MLHLSHSLERGHYLKQSERENWPPIVVRVYEELTKNIPETSAEENHMSFQRLLGAPNCQSAEQADHSVGIKEPLFL